MIGINTYKVVPGINLAIPSDYVIKFIEDSEKLLNEKKSSKQIDTKKRTLGVQMLSLTPDILNQLKERLKLDKITHGVLLVKILSDSIAEKTGKLKIM